MLYKKYRYILCIKFLFLSLGGYMFYILSYMHSTQKGTLLVVTWASVSTGQMINAILWEWPRAVLQKNNTWYTLHIPWTFDREYVNDYLSQPLPLIKNIIDGSTYEKKCSIKKILKNDNMISIMPCTTSNIIQYIVTILLILCWIFL